MGHMLSRSALHVALEGAWQAMKRDIELPDVWFTTGDQASTDPGGLEIWIPPNILLGGGSIVYGALVHEACHYVAAREGVSDTSDRGLYHNKHFRRILLKNFPDMTMDEARRPSIEPVAAYAAVTRRDPAINHLLTILGPGEPGAAVPRLRCRPQRQPVGSQSGVAARCGCQPPRRFQIAAGVLRLGPILCEVCHSRFAA